MGEALREQAAALGVLRGVGVHVGAAAVRRAVALRAVQHRALKKGEVDLNWGNMRIQCSDTNYLSSSNLVLELFLNSR